MVYATTNLKINIDVFCRIVAGYVFEGKVLANLWFFDLGYISGIKGLQFAQDLKLGLYCNVRHPPLQQPNSLTPPRSPHARSSSSSSLASPSPPSARSASSTGPSITSQTSAPPPPPTASRAPSRAPTSTPASSGAPSARAASSRRAPPTTACSTSSCSAASCPSGCGC